MTPLNWKSYQKEIPDDHYFYVRSCIRQTFYPGAEAALLHILRHVLHKDVFEDKRHTTCTGIGYHSDIVPLETLMTVVGRQLALMTEAGYKHLLVSCVTSFGIYLEILDMWKHFPEKLSETRQALWKTTRREFEVPLLVAHTSDAIFHFKEDILDKAVVQLVDSTSGNVIRGVEHVGCHYAKIFPQDGIGGAEFPKVLSGLIEAWGGEVVDYPERRHCCGFGFRHYLVGANRGYSISNSKIKFESMAIYEPDFILTNCPGCNMFLDRWQYTLSEMEDKTYDKAGVGIPVLSAEELAGLMLGMDPWTLGLQMHQVPVESLLDKMGVKYARKEKYYLVGKPTAGPEKPSVLLV
jgi:heterodisulfide reductase subunit B